MGFLDGKNNVEISSRDPLKERCEDSIREYKPQREKHIFLHSGGCESRCFRGSLRSEPRRPSGEKKKTQNAPTVHLLPC